MDIQKQFQSVTTKQLSTVLSLGMAQIYNQRPNFPITYLANWLKKYDSSQKLKLKLINQKSVNQQRYHNLQKQKQEKLQSIIKQNQAKQLQVNQQTQVYRNTIKSTKHLEDLLVEYVPEFIEKKFNFTGVYVGKLDYNKKKIQPGNFQIGAENDTQNPKIITYVGASKSHTPLMLNNFLPNGKGISYQVFEQVPDQGNQEGQQNNAAPKTKYLYINNVLKQSKLHYFKYPKLGAYACYPLKINSCLNIASLDKGIVDYKAYLKNKQETQKQYQQKVNQAKTQAQEASKKVEDFQLNEQDPASHEQKKVLEGQAQTFEQKLQQLLKNPPVVQQVKFQTVQKLYFIGCDTLGQDKQITVETLQSLNQSVQQFVKQCQSKQNQMLLKDILSYLQEQALLQNIEAQLQQHEKNILGNYQAQIKQQYVNRQKQGDYELSLIKCQKTKQLLLHDLTYKNSMEVYLNYNVPKYIELIQICCMLLGYQKQQINLQSSNQLNHRKMINKEAFKKMLQKLNHYQLKREASEEVAQQYKINKLLERLQKIQTQALSKYNGFLYVLHYLLKNYCWTRILCRDAKKQVFQRKVKQKEDRDVEIEKWNADIQKNLETAKTQLDEQGQQNFKQEQWRKNYQQQNPRPQPLEAPTFKQFLDIQ